MAVDSKDFSGPGHSTGLFTSAGTAADVTEVLGYQPSFVMVITDSSGTTPDYQFASAGDTTESVSVNGADGVTSSPAVATGITITSTGFTVASEEQTDSGTNYWIAWR